jgi:membrane protein
MTDTRKTGRRNEQPDQRKQNDGRNENEEEPDSPADLPKSSLRDAIKRARVEFKRDHLTDLAAGLTYYGTLSVVPGLILLVAILGLLGPDTTQQVANQAQQLAPGSAAEFVRTLIQQAQSNRTGAGIGAIFSLVVALWSASGYVAAFMRSSNAIYDIEEGRPIWKTLPIRIGMTIVAVIILVICVVIVVVSGPVAQQIGDIIGLGDTTVTVWNILKWPVMLILISLLLALLFWASPNAKQGGIKWVSPGGVIAVVIALGASLLFALYVTHFASYDKTYGSLAGVVIFLVWLWVANIAILLGAEINAELDHSRAVQEGLPADVEPFAEPRDTKKMPEPDKKAVEEASRLREAHHD